MHEIQRQTAHQLNQPLALSSLFLCNPCPWENKQSLDAISNLQMSFNLFRSVVLSLLRLIGILLIGGNFPNLRFKFVPRKYLGTLFFGSRYSFFPMFHGLKLNLFTGGRPQGLSQLSFQWVFWQVRKGTFLWNGCPTKSTNEGLFHTEAGWLFCGV